MSKVCQLFLPSASPLTGLSLSSSLNLLVRAKSFQGDAIAFTMAGSQFFEIRPVDGQLNEAKIRTTTIWDYESAAAKSYELVVTATERGTSLSSTAQVCHYLPVSVLSHTLAEERGFIAAQTLLPGWRDDSIQMFSSVSNVI